MSKTCTSAKHVWRGTLAGALLVAATLWAQAPQAPAAGAPPAGAPAPGGANGQGAGAAADGRGVLPGRGGQGGAGGRGAQTEPDFSPKPPIQALSPEEEATKFWLQPGFKMEPILTDPVIEEPAEVTFDGNGRMFVLELRGYMQDADGTGTLDPVGRISWHEDRDHDGKYETHGVFVDHLVFPRFVMPLGANSILTKESNADEVWKYTDTNGDGVADKKELFTTGFGRVANVEHQEGGLMWAMDNWMYSTINLTRLRWTPNGVLKEPTGSGGGQFSLSQDNYGKIWFQAGASGMPGYFQTPIYYGNFNNPDQFEPDLNITWGAPVLIADMQGGMGAVRMPDGSLARATGSAGSEVFRGDRLPADLQGDYFYGEVVARIVRRLRPVKQEGLTQLRNVYPLSEFLRTTDPLFRPVDIATAPDGTMYIADMYHGIIQESEWSGPGTYLRQRINQYQLDKVVHKGRIWRLSYEGMPRRTDEPRMLNETAAQLVAHLSDPNGWWRDTAQQLLVLKQDSSVAPTLTQMARSSANQLARIHALWTLEGLGALDKPLAQQLMKDGDPQMRLQAIRASERIYKGGDKTIGNDWKAMLTDRDPDVLMQAMMTLNTLKVADATPAIKTVLDSTTLKGPKLVASTIVNPPAGGRNRGMDGFGTPTLSPEETALIDKGETIYKEICFACHGEDGRGEPNPGTSETKAPPLAASPRVLGHQEYVIKTLLNGLTGPVGGKTYTEVMIPMGQNNDEWVAAIGSYIRNAFGNRAPTIKPADVARIRAANAGRKTSWVSADLEAGLPKLLPADATWKLSASHNPAIASYALSIQPWTSGIAQAPGMWLQVELPQPAMITEIQFESGALAINPDPIVPGAPPRTGGGGGRAAAAGAAPGAPPPPPQVGYPRGYQIQLSMDGTTWGRPVAQGTGTGASTDVTFPPTRAKFVKLTLTAAAPGVPLTIQKLKIYEPGAAK